MTKFSDVPWDDPIFNKAPLEDLEHIISLLDKASYHFADDSSKEWSQANIQVETAAKKANELGLGVEAINHLVRHKPQLVTGADLINKMLREYRK